MEQKKKTLSLNLLKHEETHDVAKLCIYKKKTQF